MRCPEIESKRRKIQELTVLSELKNGHKYKVSLPANDQVISVLAGHNFPPLLGSNDRIKQSTAPAS
jgi:hypothetical protein